MQSILLSGMLLLAAAAPAGEEILTGAAADPFAETRPRFPPASALKVEPAPGRQVRIEQRIIIRVPRRASARASLSEMPSPTVPASQQYRRKRFGSCLAMTDIAGVQVLPDDRLLLFLRDRRLIEAELERSCRAREFYQGFYMERSSDGRLCADRDLLQARSGSKCEVEQLRQLVPIDRE